MAKTNRQDWYSIPNLLTYVRILLVPLFVWSYYTAKTVNDYYLSACIIFASGLTDFLDGKIARRYNMITELGKFIDPVADKLTQLALVICLATRFSWMWVLISVFLVKEGFMMIAAGLLMLRKHKKLDGAYWYGKVSTFVFYIVMMILLFWPMIPMDIANILILICSAFLFYAFIRYGIVYYRLGKED